MVSSDSMWAIVAAAAVATIVVGVLLSYQNQKSTSFRRFKLRKAVRSQLQALIQAGRWDLVDGIRLR